MPPMHVLSFALAHVLHQHQQGLFGVRLNKKVRERFREALHLRENGQGAMIVLEPKGASMMRSSLQRVLTPEEHRLVRNWTLGVLIFYGAIALAALGVVGLHLHLADGSNESAITAVTTAATAKDQSNP
jgi:hypothetical protein